MKKEAFYFSHDYSTTNDPKVQALLGKFGAKGYGVYWRVVEILHEEQDHKLHLKPYMFEAIASTFKEEVELISSIIDYAVEVCELFIKEENFLYSERVLQNISKRDKIKEARSFAGKKSAQLRLKQNSTNVEQSLTPVEQNPTKERKVKERKVKEKIVTEFMERNIDWNKLLLFFNKTFNKSNKVFNASNKAKYLARIKEGYSRENISKAMLKANKDSFHTESNYKYCTLEYFSRSATLDKYGFDATKNNSYIPTK